MDMDAGDARFFLLNDWDPRSVTKPEKESGPEVCGPAGFVK